MQIELIIFAIIIFTYGLFTTVAIIGIGRLISLQKTKGRGFNPKFISIVVSFKNEEKNLKEFISEIVKQQYPKDKFELIMIDDCSDDQSYHIAKQQLSSSNITYQLHKQETHKGKKHNLDLAIQKTNGEIIVTTDADVVSRNAQWLNTINSYFSHQKTDLLIMPIDYVDSETTLGFFQILENIALTAYTAGFAGINKPFLCNGANLAFSKQSFETINGYQSHAHVSSGEDVFLLEDIKKLKGSNIQYGLSKELIAYTKTQSSLKDLFNQRVRWAYKAKYNSNLLNSGLGLLIILSNLVFLAWFVALAKQSVFTPYLSIFATAKIFFDFLLLLLASVFLRRTKFLSGLIFFESIYWLYALIIGTCSLFWKPNWKGKKIS